MTTAIRGIQAGDYLVLKSGDLFRITDKTRDAGGFYYTIVSLNQRFAVNDKAHGEIPLRRSGISHNQLRHMGTIVPEEEMTELFKILYG